MLNNVYEIFIPILVIGHFHYLDPSARAIKQEGVAADAPQISVEEMLKDMSIHDSDMAQD